MKKQTLLRLTLLALVILTAAPHADAGRCLRCGGKGIVYFQRGGTGTYGHNKSKRQCPICHQMVPSGVSHSDRCPDCNGTGQIQSRSSRSSASSRSSSSSSSSSSYQQYDGGFTPEQQLALDMMDARMRGYNGMVNENHSYGKAIRYDPTFHTSIGFLTDAIQKANEARIATFSRNGIGLVVMGNNGYYYNQLPQGMLDVILDVNKKEGRIVDINITELGKCWSVISRVGNKLIWNAVASEDILNKLQALNRQGKDIVSLAMDEYSNYVIVCDDGTTECSPEFEATVRQAKNKFGKILSACVTNLGGCVLCCDRGVYFKSIPSSAADILKKVDYIPRYVKVTSYGRYFISDGNTRSCYWF